MGLKHNGSLESAYSLFQTGGGLHVTQKNTFTGAGKVAKRYLPGSGNCEAIPLSGTGSVNVIALPLKSGGGISSLSGSGSIASTTGAVASLVSPMTGSGSLASTIASGRNLISAFTGSGSLASTLSAKASLECHIDIGGQPTPGDVATEILDGQLIDGFTLRSVMKLLLAAAAGDLSGIDTGSYIFKDPTGTKNRIEATVSSSARNVTGTDVT